ncbi:MAG TPA: pyridoxal-dependent decarboxylase [Chitinophagaceae bacterium]|nr:pyridoxal-dependent decarboxylase [Chitinophagaceae bacterium]
MNNHKLLDLAKEYAVNYLEDLPHKRAFPSNDDLKKLEKLSIGLPYKGKKPKKVIGILDAIGSRNTVASNGSRYFGFVFGGTVPAALAANWLAGAWDQNAVFKISSPIAAQIEKVTAGWLLDLLQLPEKSAVGFVTGTTMANFCGALAARHSLYKRKGWNCKSQGIQGAPPIRVIVGEEIHASMMRALIFAGFGLDNLITVPTDGQGRIAETNFPEIDDSTFICLQAGNVNTGAIDPVKNICLKAREKGAWVHIDGAFGLWARTSPSKSHLAEGCELADSWAIDLHKWLNVPYDAGLIMCREPKILQEALSVSAAYLPDSIEPDPYFNTPEMSRRARGIETWAALYSLGRKGVVELIERCCSLAELFAANLRNAGFEILNEVSLNQVLVSFGDTQQTNTIIKKIQDDGTCWCGGTVWKGKTAMRISVSSWMTTEEDIHVCSDAIIRIANEVELLRS